MQDTAITAGPAGRGGGRCSPRAAHLEDAVSDRRSSVVRGRVRLAPERESQECPLSVNLGCRCRLGKASAHPLPLRQVGAGALVRRGVRGGFQGYTGVQPVSQHKRPVHLIWADFGGFVATPLLVLTRRGGQ